VCTCTAECCETIDAPHQPFDRTVIEKTRQQRQVGNKTETRTLNTKWYKDFPWIHLCVSRAKVFCCYCMKCYRRGALHFTKKYENAFILDGFSNWKKARERFERHEKSESHKESVLKLVSMQSPSIMAQLSNESRLTQEERRSMLLKQLRCIRYLLRQGLALRGHTEKEGNLVKLVELQSMECPRLQQWLSDNQYLSHGIVNEIIVLMGNTLLRNMLSKIRTARWFSIMADETRDISNCEQLTIVVRWVDTEY